MKAKLAPSVRMVSLLVSVMMVFSVALASVQDKPQPKNDAPKTSEGEQKAIQKINAASGVSEKLKASAEYLKKNGKSQMRPRIAAYVAEEIARVTDHNQRVSLIETFTKTFNQPEEADLVKPSLIESLLNTNKLDEGFSEAAKYLEKKPDDIGVLTNLVWVGANHAQQRAQAGQPAPAPILQKASEAGARAVELMEGDKKPEKMDAEFWNKYRESWLPRLYQAQGVILYVNNDRAGAKDKLEKAVGLDPYDPPALLMLSNIVNDEYTKLGEQYKAEKKQAVLNQALQKMDELIDWLARAAAATEGNAQYQALNGQIMEQLKAYYSFRHEGKTDGLKELVQKYKKP